MFEYILNVSTLWIQIAVVMTALLIASITDIKTQTIPIVLFPATLFVLILIERPDVDNFIGAFLLFLMFFLIAAFGNGGGGDALMMAAVGYQLGIGHGLWCAFIAYSLYALFCLGYIITHKKKDKRKQFAFAPFALTGYAIVNIVVLFFGQLQ